MTMVASRCPSCGATDLIPTTASRRRRRVCTQCGSCWNVSSGTEVDSLVCPGCDQRVICESRPTWLAGTETSVHRLADGMEVLVRPLLYSDRRELAIGYQHLSRESRRLR